MNILSCPGFKISDHPPRTYLYGFSVQFIRLIEEAVKRIDSRKRPKPSQLVKPRMPAAAPAKHAEMNLTVMREEFTCTFGG